MTIHPQQCSSIEWPLLVTNQGWCLLHPHLTSISTISLSELSCMGSLHWALIMRSFKPVMCCRQQRLNHQLDTLMPNANLHPHRSNEELIVATVAPDQAKVWHHVCRCGLRWRTNSGHFWFESSLSKIQPSFHDPECGQFKWGLSSQCQCLSWVLSFISIHAGPDVQTTDLIIMPDSKTAPGT